MTLEQVKAMVEADPVLREARNARERAHQELSRELARAERPIVAALYDAGVPVSSVWDLVTTDEPYPAAIPVLIEHLGKIYPPRIRDAIARALGVAEARPWWRTIVDNFKAEPDPPTLSVKWGLAIAVGATGTDAVLDEVIEILRDKSLGYNRSPILQVLVRSDDPRAPGILAELANDPVLAKDAETARRKLARRTRSRSPRKHS
jgi:HEAT repeat protein